MGHHTALDGLADHIVGASQRTRQDQGSPVSPGL
jgi:hypothetical protein